MPYATARIFNIPLAPRDKVNVTVEDGLPCSFTRIHADIEPFDKLIIAHGG